MPVNNPIPPVHITEITDEPAETTTPAATGTLESRPANWAAIAMGDTDILAPVDLPVAVDNPTAYWAPMTLRVYGLKGISSAKCLESINKVLANINFHPVTGEMLETIDDSLFEVSPGNSQKGAQHHDTQAKIRFVDEFFNVTLMESLRRRLIDVFGYEATWSNAVSMDRLTFTKAYFVHVDGPDTYPQNNMVLDTLRPILKKNGLALTGVFGDFNQGHRYDGAANVFFDFGAPSHTANAIGKEFEVKIANTKWRVTVEKYPNIIPAVNPFTMTLPRVGSIDVRILRAEAVNALAAFNTDHPTLAPASIILCDKPRDDYCRLAVDSVEACRFFTDEFVSKYGSGDKKYLLVYDLNETNLRTANDIMRNKLNRFSNNQDQQTKEITTVNSRLDNLSYRLVTALEKQDDFNHGVIGSLVTMADHQNNVHTWATESISYTAELGNANIDLVRADSEVARYENDVKHYEDKIENFTLQMANTKAAGTRDLYASMLASAEKKLESTHQLLTAARNKVSAGEKKRKTVESTKPQAIPRLQLGQSFTARHGIAPPDRLSVNKPLPMAPTLAPQLTNGQHTPNATLATTVESVAGDDDSAQGDDSGNETPHPASHIPTLPSEDYSMGDDGDTEMKEAMTPRPHTGADDEELVDYDEDEDLVSTIAIDSTDPLVILCLSLGLAASFLTIVIISPKKDMHYTILGLLLSTLAIHITPTHTYYPLLKLMTALLMTMNRNPLLTILAMAPLALASPHDPHTTLRILTLNPTFIRPHDSIKLDALTMIIDIIQPHVVAITELGLRLGEAWPWSHPDFTIFTWSGANLNNSTALIIRKDLLVTQRIDPELDDQLLGRLGAVDIKLANDQGKPTNIRIIAAYAPVDTTGHRRLILQQFWNESAKLTPTTHPWIMAGDLNATLRPWERFGYSKRNNASFSTRTSLFQTFLSSTNGRDVLDSKDGITAARDWTYRSQDGQQKTIIDRIVYSQTLVAKHCEVVKQPTMPFTGHRPIFADILTNCMTPSRQMARNRAPTRYAFPKDPSHHAWSSFTEAIELVLPTRPDTANINSPEAFDTALEWCHQTFTNALSSSFAK
jgi:hypothetical protein